ncbi:PadR family transcriptional regulator [Vagococcus acidifermentans]|uniref:PadR family transcriptional regulator n=1 Tax=Vagococcus acidifermentans TaxID=564710 RepID=A0A430AVH9_9ENTE|nr:helix-turn-helix transcriptional regulator [Vagococcus acidifermentans]RSU12074.1 PadR family transcriptional regulator [Vagococcus acidifermentans]
MKPKEIPLTGTVFFILLAFSKPNYGYFAIQIIEDITSGAVRIAAGTMYGAIENLLTSDMLTQLSSDSDRGKMYQTTEYGQQVLASDVARMQLTIKLYQVMGE